MRCIKLVVITALAAMASGCASTARNEPKARSIDFEEASAFERSLQASVPSIPQRQEALLFTQPLNKKEPCKLPTSQDQLERGNFRAFWDGQCKDGYAFGLGRDIAISDTHHVEEIIAHNATGVNHESPRVNYDFVNNTVEYLTPGDKYPANTWFKESLSNNNNNFLPYYVFGVSDDSGNVSLTEYSPIRPLRLYVNDNKSVAYKYSDNSAMPVIDASAASFTAEIMDSKKRTAGGVAIVRYGNGQVRHFKINGASPEPVILPPEYVKKLSDKLEITRNTLTAAQVNIERARKMEREYLYMACNGKHDIDGLDNKTATKICNWRSQFKDPYEKALARYTQEMEQLKQKAEVAEQQRIAQQQLDVQQRRLQQQQSQQDFQQFANALGQFGQQMQNSGQQMLNSVTNQPTPQVNFAPFTPQGNNQIRCINTGPITNCRY